MPLTEELKKQIDQSINEALEDFCDAHLGSIPENIDDGDSITTQNYDIIECDKDDNEIKEYIEQWIKRIYETLKTQMYRPLYPIVEIDGGWAGVWQIELGYGIYGSEIPFIRSLKEVIEHEEYYGRRFW